MTTSSRSVGESVDGVIAVYVMRTLRDFFHMGSVECVTFHVPDSHDNWGGVMEAEVLVVGSEVERLTLSRAVGLWRGETRGYWRIFVGNVGWIETTICC